MPNEPPITLQDCIDNAVADMKDHSDRGDDPWDGDEVAMVFELADSATPIYNADLFRIASEEPKIGLVTPENALDGTPASVISANIFEAIREALWARLKAREVK